MKAEETAKKVYFSRFLIGKRKIISFHRSFQIPDTKQAAAAKEEGVPPMNVPAVDHLHMHFGITFEVSISC